MGFFVCAARARQGTYIQGQKENTMNVKKLWIASLLGMLLAMSLAGELVR